MAASPESPRYLYGKGDAEGAMAGATKLWGAAGPASLQEGSGGTPSKERVSLGELLSARGAIIGVVLFAAQQLSGINAVVYFSSATFAAVRFRPVRTWVHGVVIACWKMVGARGGGGVIVKCQAQEDNAWHI